MRRKLVDISVPLAHYLLFQPNRAARATPGYWWLSVMARLAPGATAEQARAALEPGFQAAAREAWVDADHALADRPDDPRLLVEPGAQGHAETRQAQRTPLALLLALGGLVLFAFVLPVLSVFGSMPMGLISALIIFIGLRQACNMTSRPALAISGPYKVGTGPAPAASRRNPPTRSA